MFIGNGEYEVQNPWGLFSASAICLNIEIQHSNKSCMKWVFTLNTTKQQNAIVKRVL